MARARAIAAKSDRPKGAKGVALTPVSRRIEDDRTTYTHLTVEIDRELRAAHFHIKGPETAPPKDVAGIESQGAAFWPLAFARDLDDAILHLRLNEGEVGTWVFHSAGAPEMIAAYDELLLANQSHWLAREITLFLKRTLKRVDVSSRSLITLVEQGSCFAGTLLELVLAADRSYMLIGKLEGSNRPEATLRLSGLNFGPLPMGNGLSRLESRFLAESSRVDALRTEIGKPLDAETAESLGLVTFTPDDIDWEDEVRLAIEERAAFSPDGLTGMEANLRFAGPETMETKIFARLTAWQNWIFQRPNAVGADGALKLYGSGRKPVYDRRRV